MDSIRVAWNPQIFLHLKWDRYIFCLEKRESEDVEYQKCKQHEQDILYWLSTLIFSVKISHEIEIDARYSSIFITWSVYNAKNKRWVSAWKDTLNTRKLAAILWQKSDHFIIFLCFLNLNTTQYIPINILKILHKLGILQLLTQISLSL